MASENNSAVKGLIIIIIIIQILQFAEKHPVSYYNSLLLKLQVMSPDTNKLYGEGFVIKNSISRINSSNHEFYKHKLNHFTVLLTFVILCVGRPVTSFSVARKPVHSVKHVTYISQICHLYVANMSHIHISQIYVKYVTVCN